MLDKIRRRERIGKNVAVLLEEQLTFGQRVSDRLADVAASWGFIFCFGVVLGIWVLLNTVVLIHHRDKYPYILLNLFVSMLAAIQAPVIIMSQNRREAHDRLRADHDYEVNLKAGTEIQQMNQKLGALLERLEGPAGHRHATEQAAPVDEPPLSLDSFETRRHHPPFPFIDSAKR